MEYTFSLNQSDIINVWEINNDSEKFQPTKDWEVNSFGGSQM